MSINAQVDLQSRARLAGYDPDRLDAVVLVVGMGASGQNTALNLALAGIRELRVVDADRFEQHSRTRSPLFPPGAGDGVPKATATAAALARVATHPDALVRFADARIEELGAAIFDEVDVVVSCVDAKRARAYLADRCSALGLPLVEAGFQGAEVNLAVFPAGRAPARGVAVLALHRRGPRRRRCPAGSARPRPRRPVSFPRSRPLRRCWAASRQRPS